MSVITASLVGELRAKTDAPMMECKKALTEAAGDMNKAEEILRVKLGNKASKAASRITTEGIIVAHIDTDSSLGAMVEINCETDFVSKNEQFLEFCQSIAKLVVKHKLNNDNNNNDDNIANISKLPLTMGEFGPTVEDVRKGLIGKIGENISIRRFVALKGPLASYVHNARIGVLVAYEGNHATAKDIAMHIAAMKPVALTSNDVPSELIEKERSVATAKAAESGKPSDIVAKMIEGSVQKYLKEVSLLNQAFVKNDKKTIEQVLKEANTSVSSFKLFIVGEGLEKKQDDFAAEVAAQVAAAKKDNI